MNMGMKELVEAIVAPFIDDLNEEENEMPYPRIDEVVNETVELMKEQDFSEETIKEFLNANPAVVASLHTHYSLPKDAGWKARNNEMAAKLGYDLTDYVSGKKRKEPNKGGAIELGDEHTFVDVTGAICEEYSYRDKIRRVIQERSKKKR